MAGFACPNINEERFRSSTKIVEGELRVAFHGEAVTEMQDKLRLLLAQVDAEAVRLNLARVSVDFCRLQFMTSTCFKAFVTWIDHAKDHRRYRLRFVSQDGQTWHRRSLSALQAFAPDLVTVEVRQGRLPGIVDVDEQDVLPTSDQIFLFLDAAGACARVVVGGAAQAPLDFERWRGKGIADCFVDARATLLPALERARASSTAQRVDVTIPEDEQGSRRRSFEVTAAALPSGSLVALRDVTDTTEAHKLAARLEHDEMLDALGIVTGSLAHDFNNLLVTISSFAERAASEPPGAPVGVYLDAIVGAVRRARELTSNLASFARGGDLSLRTVELSTLLDEVASTLRAFRPDLEVVVSTPRDGARVRGDASQLHRALLNIGKNAIEAMSDRRSGKIELSLEVRELAAGDAFPVPGGAYALVRVRDEGRGIDETAKARLFDPFFSGKPLGDGSGLGLFAVQGIARAHGGAVSVASEAGSGTSFVIALPLLDESPRASSPPPPGASANGTALRGAARLLVVDDDPNVGKSTQLLLEALGHQVTYERDARAALARFNGGVSAFDLVLTDLHMPGLDGLAFARELSRLGHSLPVVLVSGRDLGLRPEALASAMIQAVLPKPFTLEELDATVARLLPRSELVGTEPPVP